MFEREGERAGLNMHFRGYPKQGFKTDTLLSYVPFRGSLRTIASTANSLNIFWLESIFIGVNNDFTRLQLETYEGFRAVIGRYVVLVVFGILNELECEARVLGVKIIDKANISSIESSRTQLGWKQTHPNSCFPSCRPLLSKASSTMAGVRRRSSGLIPPFLTLIFVTNS